MQQLRNEEMNRCIDACLACHRTCEEMALDHCLRLGGEHVERDHFALMLNCADICRTAAHFMMAESDLHSRVCEVCADVCAACAKSCERVGDMQRCVAACRSCERECRAMAGVMVASR
jgi:hypothetical protein